MEMRMWCTS